MYLKQIELHGFKSFANNTVLNFEPGINGIVGPNGSGKSNISDAVRWVLGERSMKQLRGSETLDVIFAGTELKKPLGFAYVSLTIDNSDKKIPIDYNEIQVSRRLFRTGESEYKLNGVDCRLKDITELFFDTGIGKEGYSLIGQGQVEKITSGKPEERRELFDEAAGIVKYKSRKAIVEKKLEEERLNLSRVSDIVTELEKQIGPLKRQADAAKEYLKIKESLILYESNYFVREVEDKSKVIEETNKLIAENKNKLKIVNENKKAFSEKYNEIENLITTLDLQISDLKDSITEYSTKKAKIIGQIDVLKEQLNSCKQNNQGKQERIDAIARSINANLKDIIHDTNVLVKLKEQMEFIYKNSASDEDRSFFNENLQKINVVLNDFENIKSEQNLILDDLDSDESVEDDGGIEFDYSDKKIEIEKIDKEIDDNQKTILALNESIAKTNELLTKVNDDLTNAKNLFHSEETKLETLISIIERNEGYINAVKNILDNKKMFSGISGAVADLITTGKEYETAIEIAIGNNLQNIVVDTIDTSKNIIRYLKDNKLGRATMLPLSAIVPRDNSVYVKAKNEVGIVDLASNLVKYDAKFEKLVEYLLSRCLIVDTYDNAKNIFTKYNSGLKIVTLAGELFSPGGAISGGTYRNQSTLIGRKREKEEIEKNIIKFKNDIDNLSKNKMSYAETYDQDYNNLEKLKEKNNELTLKKNTISLNMQSDIKLKYSNISNKVENITTNLHKSIDILINDCSEKNKYINDDKDYVDVVNKKNEEIKSCEDSLTHVNDKIKTFTIELDEKNKQKNDNLSNRKEYYEAKDKITTELIELEKNANDLAVKLSNTENGLSEITNDMMEKYELTYVKAKEKYSDDLGDIDSIKLKIKEKKKLIQDLGNINVDAIEQYESIGSRYDTMISQYEDIKKSEEMIKGIVDELDANMHRMFDESFEKIKIEFDTVFKQLFGGGKANLELVETEEGGTLDAGISLVVQPPGKKLGNMMQLSGGEKSLTAIALLFAIQNLKPSPFCLLDEIEAALDESNVDRYADYLRKLTGHTQFIVITHRRGTMEKADRLYGITMQEKGITSIVSVDLIEDQLS